MTQFILNTFHSNPVLKTKLVIFTKNLLEGIFNNIEVFNKTINGFVGTESGTFVFYRLKDGDTKYACFYYHEDDLKKDLNNYPESVVSIKHQPKAQDDYLFKYFFKNKDIMLNKYNLDEIGDDIFEDIITNDNFRITVGYTSHVDIKDYVDSCGVCNHTYYNTKFVSCNVCNMKICKSHDDKYSERKVKIQRNYYNRYSTIYLCHKCS